MTVMSQTYLTVPSENSVFCCQIFGRRKTNFASLEDVSVFFLLHYNTDVMTQKQEKHGVDPYGSVWTC